MNKFKILKLILYFFIAPWKLMPIHFRCECGGSIFYKQPKCGWCFDVIEWEGVKEYNI